jgi:hypothetical protein
VSLELPLVEPVEAKPSQPEPEKDWFEMIACTAMAQLELRSIQLEPEARCKCIAALDFITEALTNLAAWVQQQMVEGPDHYVGKADMVAAGHHFNPKANSSLSRSDLDRVVNHLNSAKGVLTSGFRDAAAVLDAVLPLDSQSSADIDDTLPLPLEDETG